LLLQSVLSETLGCFICWEGVNYVIGGSDPPRAGPKKEQKFIVRNEKGGRMKRFEYKITTHSADTFDKIIYFCSKSGQCGIDEVSKDQTRILTDLLNNQGREGWELVQISFGKDGVMVYWKRKMKDEEK
jgi:hypothetical protein